MFGRRKRKALFLEPQEEPGRSRPALEEQSPSPRRPLQLVGSSWIKEVEVVESISSWGEASPRVQPPGEPAAEETLVEEREVEKGEVPRRLPGHQHSSARQAAAPPAGAPRE